MTYPADLEGRQAERDDLFRHAEQRARKQVERFNQSPVCSGLYGQEEHDVGAERCLCECHDPARTEPHEADS